MAMQFTVPRSLFTTIVAKASPSTSSAITTIVQGKGKPEEIAARVDDIRREIANTDSSYDKEKLQERLAKLSGGVAVLNIGAATEVELKEKKARVEDALHATRAAVKEGIVAGGGVALIRASEKINSKDLSGDEVIGAQILQKALEGPMRQILSNAGLEPAVIINEIKTKKGNFVFDTRFYHINIFIISSIITIITFFCFNLIDYNSRL
jgi:chaperonin GroEL